MADSREEAREVTDFGAPFDSQDADLIVRSSDGVDFRVNRAVLENAAPILTQILLDQGGPDSAEPRNNPEVEHGRTLPVVRLPETKAALHILLTFILPVPVHLPATFEDAIPVFVAAKKYGADAAVSPLKAYLNGMISSMVEPTDAFRVFCLARENNLRDEALGPARLALDVPITIQDLGDKLLFATNASLHDLSSYQHVLRYRIDNAVSEFLQSNELQSLWCSPHKTCTELDRNNVPVWLVDALAFLPHTRPLFDRSWFHTALEDHANQRACALCKEPPAQTKAHFWSVLNRVLNAAISQAEYDLISDGNAWTSHVDFPIPPSFSDPQGPWPFHDVPGANVILRSSDGQDFRVHQIILGAASPFFRDMFSLPRPQANSEAQASDMVDGLPIVCMTEHSHVLGNLLAMLYPNAIPAGSYILALNLLAAARKYDMKATVVLIRKLMTGGQFSSAPDSSCALFSAYAFAVHHRLSRETKHLALLSLDYQLSLSSLEDALPFLDGSAIYALSQYRTDCRKAIFVHLLSLIRFTSPAAQTFLEPATRRFVLDPASRPVYPASKHREYSTFFAAITEGCRPARR
ncbi:hypothetical protein BC834DRAFT_269857 [Gloeopeniophorella convolvens]|nr:hypothetical protein BC834DRAFT_269857 [Gloeopeniophorella convolvens]